MESLPAERKSREALRAKAARAQNNGHVNPMHLAITKPGKATSAASVGISELLLDVLGRRPDEFSSVFWLQNGVPASAVRLPADVEDYVATLPPDANVYLGINPIEGPARERKGRGTNDTVTRLTALPIDLDVKGVGGCPSLKVANAIIDDLSEVLGTRPSAITSTGGGLQPYWPIKDGDVGGTEHVGALLKRWGRLVRAVAMKHSAAVDPVFELVRVMRAPGTYNVKPAYADRRKAGEPGVPVTCVRDEGRPLTVAEVAARMQEAGVREEDADRGNTSDRVLHNPDRWKPADRSAPYVTTWLESLPEDRPKDVGSGGRHSWMISQAVRFNCALALGQISEGDYLLAQELVETRLKELRAETVEVVPPLEVYAGWVYAIEKASRKTLDQLWDDYKGDRHIWPSPEESRPCARRVAREAKLGGEPLCYWKGSFYRWAGIHWKVRSAEVLEDQLGLMFENAEYFGTDGRLRWKPNGRKLTDVIKGIRALVRVMGDEGEERPAPCWMDGHDEPVVACRNGLVRLCDGELLPHSADYFNTMALSFDYDPNAPISQRWLEFVDQVFNGDAESVEALQLWFGYVLTGRTDLEQCLYLFGPGRSGKGTITHVLQALVGLSSCAALSGSQFRGSPFAYEPLMGKSLGVLSDERVNFGKELVEAILRITGRDLISVNRKNRIGVSEHIAARLMFLSNVTPVLPDDAGAVKARIVVLHTPNQFNGENGNPAGDEGLKDRLVREELPSILRWALEGARKLKGKIPQPAISAKYADAIADSGSPISVFLREFFEFGGDDKKSTDDADRYWIRKGDAYALWKHWCDANGHEPGSTDTLKRKLIDTMPVLAPRVDFQWKDVKRGPRSEQQPAYAGLRLNEYGRTALGAARGRVTWRPEK